jgi:hypothetical protein
LLCQHESKSGWLVGDSLDRGMRCEKKRERERERERDQGGVRFYKSSVTIFSIAAFVRGGFGLCRRCVLLGSSITPHLVLPMWHDDDLLQRPSQQVSVVVRHPSLKSDTRLVVCSRLRYYFGCCSHHHSSRSNTGHATSHDPWPVLLGVVAISDQSRKSPGADWSLPYESAELIIMINIDIDASTCRRRHG